MIDCPNCKEAIDDDSHYCDQCGQALMYCGRCGRVGTGRRCTQCGAMMLTPDDYEHSVSVQTALSASGLPKLTLSNTSLNIRINGIDGAIIGRRTGPYTQFFTDNMYVSGAHAQLRYNAATGWSITDKHSSNGTMLNNNTLQPDIEMSLKNGDIVTIANINLQATID